jgi:hypothetical protein
MSKMTRISDTTAKHLDVLVKKIKKSRQLILEHAVEMLAREQFLREANEAYAKLKENPDAWKEMMDEYKEWDITLADGLEDE